MLDPTLTGNPLRWTMTQLRRALPAMLGRAAYEHLALQIDPSLLASTLDAVEAKACEMAVRPRRTVRHNRGTEVIEAGNIRALRGVRERTRPAPIHGSSPARREALTSGGGAR